MSWIVGPRQDAINAWASLATTGTGKDTTYSDVGGVRLDPRLRVDGTYALPDRVLTDPAYAAAAEYLTDWDTATTITNFVSWPNTPPAPHNDWPLTIPNGDRLFLHSGHIGTVTMPASHVFRFRTTQGQHATTSDVYNGRRRSTLSSYGVLTDPNSTSEGTLEFPSGTTVWYSVCLIIGDYSDTHLQNQYCQVLSSSTPGERNAAFQVRFDDSVLEITARSSAELYSGSINAVPTTHFSMPTPAKGEKTYIVAEVTFGPAGTGYLRAWVNGTKEVDVARPIGYYALGGNLAGLEAGLYTWDGPDPDTIYLANLEYGTASLSDRVASPLPVPNLEW